MEITKLSKRAKQLQTNGIKIIFEVEAEILDPSIGIGCVLDSDAIKKIIESDNLHDWFSASVKLSFFGIESETSYLCGCSYSSFEDFTGTDGDYFDGMLSDCYSDLKVKIAEVREARFNDNLCN